MMAAYQLPPVPAAEFLPSALSRSMKYAEPWIYGTVRGIPSRPSYGYHPHAAAIFAATEGVPGTTALAVVICSCAEYLNGTKRDVKKASVCKKCKGSRLPLATIGGTSGGTVRLPAVSGSSHSRRPMAATMRVVSTSKKSRPSILDPQKDPYDLMRRTRLLSPEPSSKDSDGKSRSRSETGGNQPRGRTRTRAPPPPAPAVNQKSQGLGVPIPTAVPDPTDLWLMEDNESLLQSSGLASSRATSALKRVYNLNTQPKTISHTGNKQTWLKFHSGPVRVAVATVHVATLLCCSVAAGVMGHTPLTLCPRDFGATSTVRR